MLNMLQVLAQWPTIIQHHSRLPFSLDGSGGPLHPSSKDGPHHQNVGCSGVPLLSNIDVLSLGANVAAITVAIVAIWVAISCARESRINHEKTLTTLAAVSERAAVTERAVGENFEKLMGTLLNMAHSIAIAPEVREAEINRLGEEQQARFQSDLIKVLSEAMKWGDGEKVEALVRAVEAIAPDRRLNSGPLRHRRDLERTTAPQES
jgi:hypothetical protein